MFAKFTDRARKVMALANQEAQRFNHEYLGTEHILLGLVKENSGVGATVLKKLGVDIKKLRLEVEKLVKSGPDMITMGKLPQTPRAKRVIEYAIAEAQALHHNYIGTEHILLGLLRESEGIAAQVLFNVGLRVEDVRQEVLYTLGAEPQDADRVRDEALRLPATGLRDEPQEAPAMNASGQTGVRRVEDSVVWQKADELARRIYSVTATFPEEKTPTLASRLREAALTIPPRLAEAWDRPPAGEARWFLNAAVGALRELQYLLDFSQRLTYLQPEDYQALKDLAEEVRRQLRTLHA